jgi:hypothetical protein
MSVSISRLDRQSFPGFHQLPIQPGKSASRALSFSRILRQALERECVRFVPDQ